MSESQRGESEDPAKTLPRSIRNIIWRTMFFFVLAIFVLVALIPWEEAGLTKSPFVAVLIISVFHMQLIL